MKVLEEKKGKATIFILSGRLDSSTSQAVEEKILKSIEEGAKDIILDFSAIEYLSSRGIRLLVHCHKEIENKQGRIILASVPKPIENVLYITGFLPYFKVFDSQSQALQFIEKQ